jgi:hypothetical protein
MVQSTPGLVAPAPSRFEHHLGVLGVGLQVRSEHAVNRAKPLECPVPPALSKCPAFSSLSGHAPCLPGPWPPALPSHTCCLASLPCHQPASIACRCNMSASIFCLLPSAHGSPIPFQACAPLPWCAPVCAAPLLWHHQSHAANAIIAMLDIAALGVTVVVKHNFSCMSDAMSNQAQAGVRRR